MIHKGGGDKNKGGNPNLQPISNDDKLTPTLSELGVSLNLSSESQALAKLPVTKKDSARVRSNKRRNLTSSQWACIAVEADEIIETIKKDARERQIKGGINKVSQLIDEANINRTDTKISEIFNTNRTY